MLIAVAVLVILVVAVFGYASTKPPTFRVERSINIQAPPEWPYRLISDFHEWETWSPWEKLDPAMKKKHEGAARGKGAVYSWDGNAKAGAGRMEIREAAPFSQVKIQLDFLRPFRCEHQAEFVLQPTPEGGTTVTWIMTGKSTIFSKLMNIDKMIGKDFEAGLAEIKRRSEAFGV